MREGEADAGLVIVWGSKKQMREGEAEAGVEIGLGSGRWTRELNRYIRRGNGIGTRVFLISFLPS